MTDSVREVSALASTLNAMLWASALLEQQSADVYEKETASRCLYEYARDLATTFGFVLPVAPSSPVLTKSVLRATLV